jgi:peptide-methionine (R)-S-oxide reductase
MPKKIVRSDAEWREQLTPEQYNITRKKATERPFTGEYDKTKDEGTYLCSCCGTELFSSENKYDSGSGWPSFWAPANGENVRMESDETHGMERTEVLCSACDAHLGHLFDDGPNPTGQRFCINSASLKLEKKEKESSK